MSARAVQVMEGTIFSTASHVSGVETLRIIKLELAMALTLMHLQFEVQDVKKMRNDLG